MPGTRPRGGSPRLRANACGSGHNGKFPPVRKAGVSSATGPALRGGERSQAVSGVRWVGAGLGQRGARATRAQQEISPCRSEDRKRAQQMLSTFFPVASSLGSFLTRKPLCWPLSTQPERGALCN